MEALRHVFTHLTAHSLGLHLSELHLTWSNRLLTRIGVGHERILLHSARLWPFRHLQNLHVLLLGACYDILVRNLIIAGLLPAFLI